MILSFLFRLICPSSRDSGFLLSKILQKKGEFKILKKSKILSSFFFEEKKLKKGKSLLNLNPGLFIGIWEKYQKKVFSKRLKRFLKVFFLRTEISGLYSLLFIFFELYLFIIQLMENPDFSDFSTIVILSFGNNQELHSQDWTTNLFQLT